ncbi:unnamed protein product [Clonostachys chloroleuca]|uniref:Uncharacterized protein n=1 Tax=Clonostachys chloroleuca TaxID=1926264 RepID=A0AA35M7Z6_9HYPO|nr:unnamed protein product [Clonostachys chloroleuca]
MLIGGEKSLNQNEPAGFSGQSDSTVELTPIKCISADTTSEPQMHAVDGSLPFLMKQSENGSGIQSLEAKTLPKLSESAIPMRDPGRGGDTAAKWRPFWLRRALLGPFCVFFLACAIALPVILHFSQKNQGLGIVRRDLGQLWRFGPTAILTVIAALWARAELQAMRFMPWIPIQPQHRRTLSREEYTLDYTSMLPHEVLIKSLDNRHFFVFFAVVCSIFIKVIVILSASVFELLYIQGAHSVDLRTLDSFNILTTTPESRSVSLSTRGLYSDVSSSQANISATTPFFHARALQDFNMSFPFGVSELGAYQTFMQATNDGARGSVNSPVTATVDGLFPETECRLLQSYKFNNITEEERKFTNGSIPTVSLQFEGCPETDIRVNVSIVPVDYQITRWTIVNSSTSRERCSSLKSEYEQFYYVAESWNTAHSSNFRPIQSLDKVAAVFCSVGIRSSRVEITDDGINPALKMSPSQDGTPVNTHSWSLLTESIPVSKGLWDNITRTAPYGPIIALANFKKTTPQQLGSSLYESKILQDVISNLTETIGPFVAHYHFKQNQNQTLTGSIIRQTPRLKVTRSICIAMAVLFGALTLITAWMMLTARGTFGAWPRNPTTILGSMTFFSDRELNTALIPDDAQSTRDEWDRTEDSPFALETWLRALFSAYALALIIALAVTLRISEISDGIATVDNDTLSIWWKSIPALAMFLVALYTASAAMAVRDLGVLFQLSIKPCSIRNIDMSFLDMFGLQALYHSFRLKNVSFILPQLLAISCVFLTALSTILFTSEHARNTTTEMTIPVGDKFTTHTQQELSAMDNYTAILDSIGALIVSKEKSNLTWPENTYKDLIFPRLELNNIEDQILNNDMSVSVEVTAAKIFPECRRVPGEEFKADVNFTAKSGHLPNTNLTVTRDITCGNGTKFPLSRSLTWNSSESAFAYVATSFPSDDDHYGLMPCDPKSEYTKRPLPPWKLRDYFWANVSVSNRRLEHHSYWRCNYSYWGVPTTVNFVHSNGSLHLDYNNLPSSDDSKRVPWNTPMSLIGLSDPFPLPGDSNITLKTTTSMFRPFLEPFGSVKMEAFGDPNQEYTILDKLHSLHRIAWGQLASQLVRSDEVDPATRAMVNAKVRDNQLYRLFQNRVVTIALLIIIGLAFIVNLWVLISSALRKFFGKRLLLDMEFKGLAPCGVNSIATMESLLHGSNTLSAMPQEPYHISFEELDDHFRSARFRFGWFMGKGTEGRELTVGALDDDKFPFLGKK